MILPPPPTDQGSSDDVAFGDEGLDRCLYPRSRLSLLLLSFIHSVVPRSLAVLDLSESEIMRSV